MKPSLACLPRKITRNGRFIHVVHCVKNGPSWDLDSVKDLLEMADLEVFFFCSLDDKSLRCLMAVDKADDLQKSYHKLREIERADPLEKFCELNPSAFECKQYDV